MRTLYLLINFNHEITQPKFISYSKYKCTHKEKTINAPEVLGNSERVANDRTFNTWGDAAAHARGLAIKEKRLYKVVPNENDSTYTVEGQ